MIFDEGLLYEQGFAITLNKPVDNLYFLFDYDERSYEINMEFQHFHSFYEIHILIDPKAAHIIEGNYYAIQQYDLVLLRPALLHKTEYPSGKPQKRLIINFSVPRAIPGLDRSLDRIFSLFENPVPIFRFAGDYQKRLFDLINEIFSLGKNHSDISELLIHTKFMEFLCEIYKNRKYNCYVPEILSDSITHKIYTITSFIHANYKKELSLDFISGNFFLSPYYLSHQFKKTTSFTLVNYIQMTRIRNAQQLLLYTDKKISDIAEECGFTSFSQFNRVFNKFCGLCPSRFRKNGDPGKTIHFVE